MISELSITDIFERRGWPVDLMVKYPEAERQFRRLRTTQQVIVLRWLWTFNETTAGKVLSRSMRYVLDHQVQETPVLGVFLVVHDSAAEPHRVSLIDWTCPCDLFQGRGKFQGNDAPCSHLCAAHLRAAAMPQYTQILEAASSRESRTDLPTLAWSRCVLLRRAPFERATALRN